MAAETDSAYPPSGIPVRQRNELASGHGLDRHLGDGRYSDAGETSPNIVANWPLSNTTLGAILDLRQRDNVLSRKQWPSFRRRKGSLRSSSMRIAFRIERGWVSGITMKNVSRKSSQEKQIGPRDSQGDDISGGCPYEADQPEPGGVLRHFYNDGGMEAKDG